MRYVLYDIATTVAAPIGAAWLALRPQYRPLLARFSPRVPKFPAKPVIVHACSVGEIGVAKVIIRAINERRPDLPILLTVSTIAGRRSAESIGPAIPMSWSPFDHRVSVRRFLNRADPRLVVLVETEVWPNMVRWARRQGTPVALVNGRISDKFLARYVRFANWLRPVFAQISAAGMQNKEYAERIAALGTPDSAIQVTGNVKFDGVVTSVAGDVQARMRGENGLPETARILVFGSTRPGDEDLAIQCWRTLRADYEDLRVVIAPRHPERVNEVLDCIGEPALRRSDILKGRSPGGERILILDTLGELLYFYSIASIAVIGGSFYPGVNGHNPLESAAVGTPTVFGPYMRNFVDPARVLVQAGGARQAGSADELADVLRELLADPDARGRLGARGREAVLANQGAVGRTVEFLESLLGQAQPAGR